jgi:hypothetical protein
MSKKRPAPYWVTAPRVNRNPALAIACPQCEVPAGTVCIGSQPVHAARREASYRARYGQERRGT